MNGFFRRSGPGRDRAAALLLAAIMLAGCADDAAVEHAIEVVVEAPVQLIVEADGTVKSAKATPLNVPGEQWSRRQLIWMKADGSRVDAGEVVARFSAAEGELELAKALLDLQRNMLARVAKDDELDAAQGRVGVDLAQVGTELAIAQRYAGADLAMFARNEILDAIQDQRFLGEKQGVLEWKRGQASERGGAELAVLESQKATFQLNADRRRRDLEALELRAPNAGVLVLSPDWSGEKPKVGANLWAGNEFATLPDISALEVELTLPQLEAQGIAKGLQVDLQPAGRPEQAVTATVTWVAGAPAQRGRGNPVKYLSLRAVLPADAVARHGWVPGQAFRGRIHLQQRERGISVPNVAVIADGDRRHVDVLVDGRIERRAITLGVRGPARSEVVEGLRAGDAVVLTPSAAKAGGTARSERS